MATPDRPVFDTIMSRLPNLPAPSWEDPSDLGRISIEAFMSDRSEDWVGRSAGQLRLAGSAVMGHSADLADVGQIASLWQRCLSAVGAALEGSRSSIGRIPEEVLRRTQLVLVAAPAPGSVVLTISPRLDRSEPSADGTESLFTDEIRSLADRASESLLALLQMSSVHGPDDIDRLTADFTELGARVASSVKALADVLVKSELDIDVAWSEPKRPTQRATLDSESAGWLTAFVEGKELDAEEETVIGVVRTVSDIARWSVETEEGVLPFSALGLSGDVVGATTVGTLVSIRMQVKSTARPDGSVRKVRTALDLQTFNED